MVRSELFTLIDGDRVTSLRATLDGGAVRIAPDVLRDATGWELKPEGLCQGNLCIPVRDRAALVDARGVDLAGFARAQGRPLALDVVERAAALGTSAAERSARLATLEAPDFSLPDLHGSMHALSAHRGKKALLIVYASW
jgi:transposase